VPILGTFRCEGVTQSVGANRSTHKLHKNLKKNRPMDMAGPLLFKPDAPVGEPPEEL